MDVIRQNFVPTQLVETRRKELLKVYLTTVNGGKRLWTFIISFSCFFVIELDARSSKSIFISILNIFVASEKKKKEE
jgi:hypothetical protein